MTIYRIRLKFFVMMCSSKVITIIDIADQVKCMSRFTTRITSLALSIALVTGASHQAFAENNTQATADKATTEKWSVNNPQGEFTTANIDVRQGTWMNVDISPDAVSYTHLTLPTIYSV